MPNGKCCLWHSGKFIANTFVNTKRATTKATTAKTATTTSATSATSTAPGFTQQQRAEKAAASENNGSRSCSSKYSNRPQNVLHAPWRWRVESKS